MKTINPAPIDGLPSQNFTRDLLEPYNRLKLLSKIELQIKRQIEQMIFENEKRRPTRLEYENIFSYVLNYAKCKVNNLDLGIFDVDEA